MISFEDLTFKASQNESANKLLVRKLKKNTPAQLDQICQALHEAIFEEIDCLDCANCCRSLGPRLTDRDIDKLARFLKLKPSAFADLYLRIDEDGDYVFKNMPCPFLCSDNYCSVYDNRPKACREYPHTDSRKMIQLLPLALKNAATCPAVLMMLEQLRKKYP